MRHAISKMKDERMLKYISKCTVKINEIKLKKKYVPLTYFIP